MDRALEELLATDEELRARLAAAAAAAKVRVEAARAARDRRAAVRLALAGQEISAQLRRVSDETTAELQRRGAQRAEWQKVREARAEPLLSKAAEAWARIVRGGP